MRTHWWLQVAVAVMLAISAAAAAQDTGSEEAESWRLPPPDPRSVTTTEKPIEGGLPIGTEAVAEQPPAPSDGTVSDTPTQQPAQQPATAAPGSTAVRAQAPATLGTHLMEELSIYNVPSANLRTMKTVIDENYNLRGMVYGDELTYLHILEADNGGNFRETWRSPSLNGEIRGVFVDDLEGDGTTEIVAYTANGDFFIYGFENRNLRYKTPDNTYESIECMVVADIDDSPEKEIFFLAVRPGDAPPAGQQASGNLIQFDPVSQFEEWISQERYPATDMVIGNVDSDDEMEIVLNSGEVLDILFKDVKWKSDVAFGSRLYLIDMDNDGLLEVVTEYSQAYIRIFDIDQRREKW